MATKAGLGRGGAEPTNPDVTWDDQKRINRFGQLNLKMDELKDQLKKQKENLENLNDAASALEMVMDDNDVLLRYGSVYVQGSEDAGNAFVERLQGKSRAEIADSELAMAAITDEMMKLKAILYAKFGNSINLETNPEA